MLQHFQQQQPTFLVACLAHLDLRREQLGQLRGIQDGELGTFGTQVADELQQQMTALLIAAAQALEIDPDRPGTLANDTDLADLVGRLRRQHPYQIDQRHHIGLGTPHLVGQVGPRRRRTLEAGRIVEHPRLEAILLSGQTEQIQQHHPQPFTGRTMPFAKHRLQRGLGLAHVAVGVQHGGFLESGAQAGAHFLYFNLPGTIGQRHGCITEVNGGQLGRRGWFLGCGRTRDFPAPGSGRFFSSRFLTKNRRSHDMHNPR